MPTKSQLYRRAKKRLVPHTRKFATDSTFCFTCHALSRVVTEALFHKEDVSFSILGDYTRVLEDCGLSRGCAPEYLMNNMGLTDEQKQGARYMFLELVALECEDEDTE